MNKPFQSITLRGRERRLRQMAIHALEQYDLDISSIHRLGWFTNMLFRVRTTQGKSYALRLCAPGWRTEMDIHSETLWLKAIHLDTDIPAPRPIPARNGELVIEAPLPDIPGYGRCVLMTWIPGTPLGKHLTEKNLYKMRGLWGYPVQDIAMAMQDLMTDVPPQAFETLQAAFRRGYESLLPWPEVYRDQVDVFRAGRILWVANRAKRNRRCARVGF